MSCDVVLLCDGIAQNYPSSAAHCSRRLHTHVDERAAAAVSCRVWRDAELPQSAIKASVHARSAALKQRASSVIVCRITAAQQFTHQLCNGAKKAR